MKINKLLFTAITCLALFSACDDDDNFIKNQEETPSAGDYEDGFFVLNEGSSAPGTITYVSDDFQTVVQDVCQLETGKDIGNYAQSIFFNGDLAYIISNGSNLITVVNRYTFEYMGIIDEGLEVPRYGVVYNGKAYVTNQGGFEDAGATEFDDYLAVINLETLAVEKKVELNDLAEHVEEHNGRIYIENATYGTGNHISVYNTVSGELEPDRKIETNEGLNSIAIEGDYLYALSASKFQKISLSSGEVTKTVNFSYVDNSGEEPMSLSAKNLQIEDNSVYYTVNNNVYVMELGSNTAPDTPLLSYDSNSPYGVMYGFAVEDYRIYLADAADFVSNGHVEVYDINGELLKKFDAGVGPNGFYFND